MALTAKQQAIVARAKRHGIVAPADVAFEVWLNRKPKPEGFDFALICAMLMIETAGGKNVFGHDPTIYVGAGTVTKAKYLGYRTLRNRVHRFQGVGGMQLTYGGYQDEADKLGGCWVPRFNMRVGFTVVRNNIERHGLWGGVAAYNGSGPMAQAYANKVLASRHTWAALLSGATLRAAEPDLEDFGDVQPPDWAEILAGVAAEHDDARREDPLWLPH